VLGGAVAAPLELEEATGPAAGARAIAPRLEKEMRVQSVGTVGVLARDGIRGGGTVDEAGIAERSSEALRRCRTVASAHKGEVSIHQRSEARRNRRELHPTHPLTDR